MKPTRFGIQNSKNFCKMADGKMSTDVDVEDKILYDLSVNSEWQQDPEKVVCMLCPCLGMAYSGNLVLIL